MSHHVANQLPLKSTCYRKQRQIHATWNATCNIKSVPNLFTYCSVHAVGLWITFRSNRMVEIAHGERFEKRHGVGFALAKIGDR
ncbi:hypothetical protein F9K79_00350 [Ochrobactrum sp. Kaboul]|nr:hypothetical protein F9K79_00350 [Ochrobactrum sp. Kaboul]